MVLSIIIEIPNAWKCVLASFLQHVKLIIFYYSWYYDLSTAGIYIFYIYVYNAHHVYDVSFAVYPCNTIYTAMQVHWNNK